MAIQEAAEEKIEHNEVADVEVVLPMVPVVNCPD